MTEPTTDTAITIDQVRDHIGRYMTAVHGKDWVYRAPETFGNLVERWLLAVASGDVDFAGEQISEIERLAAERDAERSAR